MNFIKSGSMFVFLLFAGLVSVALGCGGGNGFNNQDVPLPPGFAPVTERITTTLQIQVVNGNTGQAVPNATVTVSPLGAYTGTDQSPSWFMGTISPSYQTDSGGTISITGSTSVPNDPTTTFDHSMAYNWTCSAPNLRSVSGSQVFPATSWLSIASERSVSFSSNDWSAIITQRILLYP